MDFLLEHSYLNATNVPRSGLVGRLRLQVTSPWGVVPSLREKKKFFFFFFFTFLVLEVDGDTITNTMFKRIRVTFKVA
jgi:hypothetical protein